MDSGPVVKSEEKSKAQESPQASNEDFSIKHPLQHAWVLWYDNPGKKTTQESWGDHLKKIYTFSTVEDFWSLWNNIKTVSDLPIGCQYHIFKEGVEPKWEDSANERGGKWVATVKNSQNNNNSKLNHMWLGLVLAAIGCSFEDDEDVCGVVVSVRKAHDKIAIWTKTADNAEVCKRIGQQFRESLGAPNISVGYQSHGDAKDNDSSYRNQMRYQL